MILAADKKGPDRTAHLQSLIWAFVVRACPEGTVLLGAAHTKCKNYAAFRICQKYAEFLTPSVLVLKFDKSSDAIKPAK